MNDLKMSDKEDITKRYLSRVKVRDKTHTLRKKVGDDRFLRLIHVRGVVQVSCRRAEDEISPQRGLHEHT